MPALHERTPNLSRLLLIQSGDAAETPERDLGLVERQRRRLREQPRKPLLRCLVVPISDSATSSIHVGEQIDECDDETLYLC